MENMQFAEYDDGEVPVVIYGMVETDANTPILQYPHDRAPVNEYSCIDLFEKSFPTLFPYGCGMNIKVKA